MALLIWVKQHMQRQIASSKQACGTTLCNITVASFLSKKKKKQPHLGRIRQFKLAWVTSTGLQGAKELVAKISEGAEEWTLPEVTITEEYLHYLNNCRRGADLNLTDTSRVVNLPSDIHMEKSKYGIMRWLKELNQPKSSTRAKSYPSLSCKSWVAHQ